MSDSLGGSISYYHNTLNQLTYMFLNVSSMMVAELTFGFGSNNLLSTVTMSTMMGHIFTGTYSYNSANDVTGITYKDVTASTTLATFSYTFNAGSEISAYTGPDGSLSYTYDHDGQLTGVSGAHSESYSFDSNGNRNMASYIYTTGNEITADAAGNSFTEDDDGNVVTKTDSSGNVWTYTFDFHNRLTEVVEKNSGGTTILTESMTYDVFGNLIGLAVNGTPQRWTVFDGVNPYLDFNGSGTLTQRWLTNPTARDQYFASVSAAGTVEWLLTDDLGSIREVVSSGGSALDKITYGAFGNILSQTNSSCAPRFLYAGGEWDGNLGLYLFGARWDDPVDGRWVSRDPLGLRPDDNPYRYVENAPLALTDPTGNVPWPPRLPYPQSPWGPVPLPQPDLDPLPPIWPIPMPGAGFLPLVPPIFGPPVAPSHPTLPVFPAPPLLGGGWLPIIPGPLVPAPLAPAPLPRIPGLPRPVIVILIPGMGGAIQLLPGGVIMGPWGLPLPIFIPIFPRPLPRPAMPGPPDRA